MMVDCNKHCELEFGKYAHVHEAHNNKIQSCVTGDIVLRPTGNSQGAYYFISLFTGSRLNLQHFTPLSFPQK